MFRFIYFGVLGALIFASAVTARDVPSRTERPGYGQGIFVGTSFYR